MFPLLTTYVDEKQPRIELRRERLLFRFRGQHARLTFELPHLCHFDQSSAGLHQSLRETKEEEADACVESAEDQESQPPSADPLGTGR